MDFQHESVVQKGYVRLFRVVVVADGRTEYDGASANFPAPVEGA